MSVVAVTAGKASPGATTAAVALGLSWPRPVLLVDADPGGGDVVPGFLPGRVTAAAGVLSWLVATRRCTVLEAAAAFADHAVAVPEAPGLLLLPGVQHSGQAGALTGGWERLAQAVEREPSSSGRDVLVDTGRLGAGSCWPVLAVADRVLLAVRPSARSVHACVDAARVLRERLGDLDRVRLLVCGAGPYSAGQVAAAVGVDVAAALPADGAAAGVLTEGAAPGLLSLHRSRLLRAAAAAARDLAGPAPAAANRAVPAAPAEGTPR